MEEKKTASHEIKVLSLLLLFSFLTAGIIAAYLILNYGPTGRYLGKNTALAPDVLEQIHYLDGRLGSPFKTLFDKIEFTFKSKSVDVGIDAYAQFYLTIASDESLDALQIPAPLFDRASALITIYTKPEKTILGEEGRRAFQRIEFADDGNHYRIELIGDNESVWAYFKHSGILDTTKKLFTKS